MYLFRRYFVNKHGEIWRQTSGPFYDQHSCITHCKLLLDTLVTSRYTFNEHFEQAGALYADCKLLREQGMNPKQECHDLDPDHS